jgi:hypothetical protein
MGIIDDFLNAEGHEPLGSTEAQAAVKNTLAAASLAAAFGLTTEPATANAASHASLGTEAGQTVPVNFGAMSDEVPQDGHLINTPSSYFAHDKKNNLYRYVDTKNQVFPISAPHFELIKKISKNYGIPLTVTLAMIAKESSFNPQAENPGSGALGWLQFLPATFYERVYKDAEKIKTDNPETKKLLQNIKELIKRERIETSVDGKTKVILKYAPTSDAAKNKLRMLAKDPAINLQLGMELALISLRKLQMDLYDIRSEGAACYELTPADLYAAHFAGTKAAANIIRDAYLERNHGINQHFASSAKSNKTNQALLLNERGKPVTAAQLMAQFGKMMGNSEPLNVGCPSSAPESPKTIEGIINHHTP